MHACIAAFSSGVVVVPMAYSRKFNGLFTSLNYTAVLDCLKLNTDEAMSFLLARWNARDQLTQQIKDGNSLAQAKLDRYVSDIAALLPA